MSNEMYGQSSAGQQQMLGGQMRGGLNALPQWGQYAICTKHEQPIDMFCMAHNKALCQQCVRENVCGMMQQVNAPSDQMARNCQLKFTD